VVGFLTSLNLISLGSGFSSSGATVTGSAVAAIFSACSICSIFSSAMAMGFSIKRRALSR
jgi:hypothetical protein